MPVFMIERRFAEQLESSAEAADGINRINDEEGVRWLYSFLSADRRKTYCLYEAPSPDAIRRAAVRAGVPADVVVEMSERVLPDGSQTAATDRPQASSCSVAYRAAWVRLAVPVFIRMLRMWLAAVLLLMNSRAADLPVAQAGGQQPEHLDLPGGQLSRSGRAGQRLELTAAPGPGRSAPPGPGPRPRAPGRGPDPSACTARAWCRERLGDVHHRPHPAVHVQRRGEVPLGGLAVAEQRGDPREVAVGAAEHRDELAADEVHPGVGVQERPQHERGVAVAERERALGQERQLDRPVRVRHVGGEVAVEQVPQRPPDALGDVQLGVEGEQAGHPAVGERLAPGQVAPGDVEPPRLPVEHEHLHAVGAVDAVVAERLADLQGRRGPLLGLREVTPAERPALRDAAGEVGVPRLARGTRRPAGGPSSPRPGRPAARPGS